MLILLSVMKVPMLLPQNIVLSAMDTETNIDHVEWHDLKLPFML
jgi:hypothetical protein